MLGELPKSLLIDEEEYPIETDFRFCLATMGAFADEELGDYDKREIMLRNLYGEKIPKDLFKAIDQAIWFLNGGKENKIDTHGPILMDWEQDESYIFSGIAKVIGRDVRADEYCHWWTFLSYFMEIGEGTFSTIRAIRSKLAKGEKLEKWEQEFYGHNPDVIDLQRVKKEEDRLWDSIFTPG